MTTLNITAQKTAVQEESESRNSVRPVLEEAGFGLDYDSARRKLIVLDGKDKIAQIVGVKGIEDVRARSKGVPISWVGSDLGEEIFLGRGQVKKILGTNIGACTLEYILPKEYDYTDPLDSADKILTKYPAYLQRVLSEYYSDTFKTGRDAPEFSPECRTLDSLIRRMSDTITYSDSPDTRIADEIDRDPKSRPAGWEIVETGNSTRVLDLKRIEDDRLTRQVTTDIYANKNIGGEQQETLNYFIGKIRTALER